MNISPVSSHVTTAMVSPQIAAAAAGDGDGLTGAAALNDGDAAALAASSAAKAAHPAAPAAARPGSVDVTA
jgi:hypothetical protein